VVGTRVGVWLALVAGLVGLSSPAFAGAWTLPAGDGQVIVTSLASFAEQAFGSARAMQPAARYRKLELQALIEYGLTNRLTAIAMPSLQSIDIAPPMDARRGGVGYSEFGARYRVWETNGWVFSGQASVRVPGTDDIANPAAIGYTDFEFDIRALAGTSFPLCGFPAFVDLQAAHRFRVGGPPDEFRADVTLGINVTQRLMLLAQSFNVISEGAGAPGFSSYDYFKLQLSAVYALTPALSLQLGGYATYAGRNALQEDALIFAAWYRF
jgi:hypothetical protein